MRFELRYSNGMYFVWDTKRERAVPYCSGPNKETIQRMVDTWNRKGR